jgi:hypothetical protein
MTNRGVLFTLKVDEKSFALRASRSGKKSFKNNRLYGA